MGKPMKNNRNLILTLRARLRAVRSCIYITKSLILQGLRELTGCCYCPALSSGPARYLPFENGVRACIRHRSAMANSVRLCLRRPTSPNDRHGRGVRVRKGPRVAASVMAKPGGAKLPRALKASAAARRIRSTRVAERVRRKSPKDNLVARAWPANYSGTHPTAISLIGPRPSPVLAGRSLLQSQHVALQRGLGSASRRHAWRR